MPKHPPTHAVNVSTTKAGKTQRIQLALTAGFTGILVLVIIVTLVGLSNINALQQDSELIVNNHMTKIELTTAMYTQARQRIVNILKISLIEDPFLRDEQVMMLDSMSTQFVMARQTILAMSLNKTERQLLDDQGKLTQVALPIQREIIDLLYNEELEQARQLLVSHAIPAQDRVLAKLEELYRYQKAAANEAAAEGRHRQLSARRLMLMLAGAALSLGIAIAVWVVIKISRAAAEREQHLLNIETMNQTLTSNAKEIAAAQHRAEQASRAKSAFLANMSHEIRTPLTAIIGFSESLLDDSHSPSDQTDAVHTVIDSGKHLLNIINDILDISKVEAEQLEIENVPVSPFTLLSEIDSIASLQASEKGIAFDINYIYPLPSRINSDPVRLKQILLNIVNNAIKFTHKGNVSIHVIYRNESQRLEFHVIDTGIGMTQEQQQKLFKPFMQADSSTTRKFGGTGLGLHLSKQLCEKLNGELTFSSEANGGSCFVIGISVPQNEQDDWIQCDQDIPTVKNDNKEQLHHVSGHILLAEDVEANQRLISIFLKRLGATVEIAPNGQVAVDKALEKSFDLVLMDMQMPIMDGYQAVQTLRTQGYNNPIVALTANVMKQDIKTYQEIGCDGFLSKPIQRAEFNERVAAYLNDK